MDKDGRTPLHDVTQTESEYAILLLLDVRADVNATDKNGRSPLHGAAQSGSKDAIAIAEQTLTQPTKTDERIFTTLLKLSQKTLYFYY